MVKLAHLTSNVAETVFQFVSTEVASSCQSMADSASLQITVRHGSYQTRVQNVTMGFAPHESLLQLAMNANSMTSVTILFAAEASAPLLWRKA